MTNRSRALLVTPRPPKEDGQGDQRRAHGIVAALSPEWEVQVLSWLPEVRPPRSRRWGAAIRKLVRTVVFVPGHPLQVAYFQAAVPRSVRQQVAAARHDCVIFLTDRAVMPTAASRTVLDFVDDIGGSLERRARSSRGPAAWFWRWEGDRVRRFDRLLAERVTLAIAHSAADAAGISPLVQVVPLSITTRPLPEEGEKVVFIGNLFYAPNHEAALWMCEELVPELARSGIDSGQVVIAGRRPRPSLVSAAARAGIDFRPDFVDQGEILREAAVALAPMALGSGNQCKTVDAVGAGRPCVLTPVANAGLDLVDGRSALVRGRHPEAFADAILRLLGDASLRRGLAVEALAQLSDYTPEAVRDRWRSCLWELVRAPATGT